MKLFFDIFCTMASGERDKLGLVFNTIGRWNSDQWVNHQVRSVSFGIAVALASLTGSSWFFGLTELKASPLPIPEVPSTPTPLPRPLGPIYKGIHIQYDSSGNPLTPPVEAHLVKSAATQTISATQTATAVPPSSYAEGDVSISNR